MTEQWLGSRLLALQPPALEREVALHLHLYLIEQGAAASGGGEVEHFDLADCHGAGVGVGEGVRVDEFAFALRSQEIDHLAGAL